MSWLTVRWQHVDQHFSGSGYIINLPLFQCCYGYDKYYYTCMLKSGKKECPFLFTLRSPIQLPSAVLFVLGFKKWFLLKMKMLWIPFVSLAVYLCSFISLCLNVSPGGIWDGHKWLWKSQVIICWNRHKDFQKRCLSQTSCCTHRDCQLSPTSVIIARMWSDFALIFT